MINVSISNCAVSMKRCKVALNFDPDCEQLFPTANGKEGSHTWRFITPTSKADQVKPG